MLVFCQFGETISFIQQALTAQGIRNSAIDGSMSVPHRNKAIESFHSVRVSARLSVFSFSSFFRR
jgi:superfamily II DNA/RNA helicase